jgi:hypothetical protein
MAALHGLGALPSRPQERLYSAHLSLNTELQRSGFRSVQIAWNAGHERHGTRVVDDGLDVVEKELSARIEVNATLETRPPIPQGPAEPRSHGSNGPCVTSIVGPHGDAQLYGR